MLKRWVFLYLYFILSPNSSFVQKLNFLFAKDNFLFQVRRLRFRRPRPKLIDVENPDGDLVGSPVELKEQGEDLHPWHGACAWWGWSCWALMWGSSPLTWCRQLSCIYVGDAFNDRGWQPSGHSSLIDGHNWFNVKLIMRTGQIELGNWFPRQWDQTAPRHFRTYNGSSRLNQPALKPSTMLFRYHR